MYPNTLKLLEEYNDDFLGQSQLAEVYQKRIKLIEKALKRIDLVLPQFKDKKLPLSDSKLESQLNILLKNDYITIQITPFLPSYR